MRRRVLIACPNQMWLHKHVVFALLRLQQDQRHLTRIILPTHRPYINSLHKIINEMLAEDWEFLLSFDDDNPPKRNPLDLVELDLDIVGCPTPVWHCLGNGEYPIYYNALDVKPGTDGYKPHEPTEGLQEVDVIGSGCLLVHRRVFEGLRDAPRHDRWFFRTWNDKSEAEYSGDYSFCRRAKAAGFRVWAHYDYPCMHFNELELTEVQKAFHAVLDG